MRSVLGLAALAALAMLSCGGGTSSSPPCFTPQPGSIYFNRDAVFVANTGSSSISAFQTIDFTPGYTGGGVCGSPFPMNAPPTALGGGALSDMGLVVVSQAQKSISLYPVNILTSVLSAPLFTITTRYTPVAVASVGAFFYVANAEGSVSAFRASANGTVTELAGSPFPAGSGPVAIVAADQSYPLPNLLYVANSQSNNISAYSLDPNTFEPIPVAASPYAAGEGPASIVIAPAMLPNPFGPRLVMVANKLSNNVSVFSSAGDGSLTPVPGSPFPAGAPPSSVGIATNLLPLKFAYVTIPGSNEIAGYSIDGTSGALTPLAGSPFPAGVGPLSAVVADGYLFAANNGSNDLSVYSIDQSSGALTPVAGSPFPVGQSPTAVLYFQVPQ